MNKKFLSILVAGLVIISSTIVVYFYFSQNPDPGIDDTLDPQVAEWLDDFNALYNFIEGNYPYLWVKNRTHGYNWLDLKSTYENRIRNAEDDVEFLCILFDAVTALQNRHTDIINPRGYAQNQETFGEWSEPVGSIYDNETVEAAEYWESVYVTAEYRRMLKSFRARIVYEKGDYVIVNSGTWNDLYGEDLRVVAVNGTPIDDAVMGVFEKDYVDWDYQRGKSFLWRISPRDFGRNAEFTIRNSTGFEVNMTFSITPSYSGSPYEYPNVILDTELWEDESTAYLYVRTFEWSIIQNYLTEFTDFYSQIEGYDNLIIDIRGNTGGNYLSWIEAIVEPLIGESMSLDAYLAYRTDDYSSAWREWSGLNTEVQKESFAYLPPEVYGNEFRVYEYKHDFIPDLAINFTGDITLLTDHVVYSAAEAFTLFCKQSGFATIYGTTSGGDGLMAFPTFFRLPNSRLVINIVSALGLDNTGHANEEVRTQPDIYFESAFGNFSELIDFVRDNLP